MRRPRPPITPAQSYEVKQILKARRIDRRGTTKAARYGPDTRCGKCRGKMGKVTYKRLAPGQALSEREPITAYRCFSCYTYASKVRKQILEMIRKRDEKQTLDTIDRFFGTK
jgi:hypothetical protein